MPIFGIRPSRRYKMERVFLVQKDGGDTVVLNRKGERANGSSLELLEIARCRERGQHYYVAQKRDGKLEETTRRPSRLVSSPTSSFAISNPRPGS